MKGVNQTHPRMDSLTKLRFSRWDLGTLFRVCDARQHAGHKPNKRTREILTACIFALVLENNERHRFHIAFVLTGDQRHDLPVEAFFEDGVGEYEDWDIVIAPGEPTKEADKKPI